MLGRVVHSEDFKRLLATAPRSRSAHFAVHFVAGPPVPRFRAPDGVEASDLSTDPLNNSTSVVDKHRVTHWLGTVLPKRHAKRAVTRNLLRRQIRVAMLRHAEQLPAGSWLVRLRGPFARTDYPSAASNALRDAARTELDSMLVHAAR